VRGQLKVLYPATRWSRGENPIGRNAMKTRETWNADGSLYDAQHFQILGTLLGLVWNHLITPITRRHQRNRPDYFLSEMLFLAYNAEFPVYWALYNLVHKG